MNQSRKSCATSTKESDGMQLENSVKQHAWKYGYKSKILRGNKATEFKRKKSVTESKGVGETKSL